MIQPEIIFEDEVVLAVAKPPGMVVNRAETVGEATLQDWVEQIYGLKTTGYEGEQGEIFRKRSGIAHRLDKETSGLMIIGKTPASLAELMRQFRERETEKEYLALVHGLVQPGETVINLPIKRSTDNRHKFRVDVDGKPALTGYRVERRLAVRDQAYASMYQDGFSLVRLFPKTGRTHQIRVHMSHIGYPLVGDELYGGRKRIERDRTWCPRHFLHAASLKITHPETRKDTKFEASLPGDLQTALEFLYEAV